MAVSTKTNDQTTSFPSYITMADLENEPQNDILTGTTGSVFTAIMENTTNGGTDLFYLQFYDNNNPTVGTTAQEMKFRNRNATGAIRIMHVFVRFGHAFSNACSVAATSGADNNTAPSNTSNVIILGD
jgi:hypothetical protein